MQKYAWTAALVLVAIAMVPSHAEEASMPLLTGLSSTTISGYVDTSAHWNPAGSPNFSTEVEVVPEPGTAALAVFGGLFLLGAFLRKRQRAQAQ